MSETTTAGITAGQSLPIVVRWVRSKWLLITALTTLLCAGSLYVILAPSPLPADAVQIAAIVTLAGLCWSAVRHWWGASRSDVGSTDAPTLRPRSLILYGAAIGASVYVVSSPFALGSGGVRVVGVLGLLLFGVLGSCALISFRPGRVAVRIDEGGILDRTTFLASPQPIPWSDLQSVTTRTVSGEEWIVLGYVQPREFVARQALWRRPLLRMNWSLLGSPIGLHATGLDRSRDDLVDAIRPLLSGADEP